MTQQQVACRQLYDGDFVYKSKDTLLDFLLSHSPNPGNLSDEERRNQYDSYLSELDHWK